MLAIVFALESAGLGVLLVLLLVLVVLSVGGGSDATSLGSALAIVVLTALGVLALVLLSVGAWRARSWVRSAGIVWQIVQLLVGLAVFQGRGAQPVLGAVIALPALAGLVLLFTPSVRDALRRPERPAPEPPPVRRRR